MRLLRTILGTLSVLLLACPEPPTTPVCGEGLACPQVCSAEAGCGEGQVCSEGLCGQPPPTSTQYAACALDSDCPRGDYCDLGACSHDCLSDRDCSGDAVCSDRGRCVAPEQVGAVEPISAPLPPALVVSAQEKTFGPGVTTATVELSNSGGTPFKFRALSDEAWLSVEPSEGQVSGQPVTLTLTLDPALAGPDTLARLRINSNAGVADLRVNKPFNLTGAYGGEVQMTTPIESATSMLSLHLFQLPGTTTLSGYVDPDQSLLFPARAGVSGEIAADGQVTLSFVLAGAPGSRINPHTRSGVRRTVTLTGTVSPQGIFSGAVTDSIEGLREGPPVVVSGTFSLQYGGAPAEGQASAVPDIVLSPVTSPFTDQDATNCASCPEASACGTPLEHGLTYLRNSAPYYRAFKDAVNSTAKDKPSPFRAVLDGTCSAGSCLNGAYLRCAQYQFHQLLAAEPTNVEAQLGLLDALEVQADFGVLVGNDRIVSATEAWKGTTTLSGEIALLESGNVYFRSGTRSQSAAEPAAFLDPYILKLLEGLPASTLGSTLSHIPGQLGDDPGQRGTHEHLRRAVLAVGGALRSKLEVARRQHRDGNLDGTREAVWRGAMVAYLDLASLGVVLVKAGSPTLAELQPVREDFRALSQKFDDLNAQRNPAGYRPEYVPFLFKVSDPTRNNFEQIHDYALNEVFFKLAEPERNAAYALQREFEVSSTGLLDQIDAQDTVYESQLVGLCGTIDLNRCGVTGSELDMARREWRSAAVRLQVVEQRVASLNREVEIEVKRAAAIADIHEAEAEQIQKDGSRRNVLEKGEAAVEAVAAITSGISAGLSAAGSSNPFNFVAAVVGIGGSILASGAQSEIDIARNIIETNRSARVEFSVAQAELINSAAEIEKRLLEQDVLVLEARLAQMSIAQASAAVVDVWRRAQLIATQRARMSANNKAKTFSALQFRVYADAASLRAQKSFNLLMDWSYLATRALEYEMNVSYVAQGDLWRAPDANALRSYLFTLQEFYKRNRPPEAQLLEEVLSLRDDLLNLGAPLTDAVTGHVYTPAERFRRYVADPANRDVNGDLRVRFMTYRPDQELFTRAVCNDRIAEVRLNLIGDNLGAGKTSAAVLLSQGGASYLRDCQAPDQLVSYNLLAEDQKPRQAFIQAGVNAPNSGRALLPNTDLTYRALMGGPWELVIEMADANNQGLELGGLDDIELLIHHRASTIQ